MGGNNGKPIYILIKKIILKIIKNIKNKKFSSRIQEIVVFLLPGAKKSNKPNKIKGFGGNKKLLLENKN